MTERMKMDKDDYKERKKEMCCRAVSAGVLVSRFIKCRLETLARTSVRVTVQTQMRHQDDPASRAIQIHKHNNTQIGYICTERRIPRFTFSSGLEQYVITHKSHTASLN